MLSILIPTYNYKVSELIEVLNLLASKIDTKYEILCLEDGSNQFVDENRKALKSISFATHLVSKKNRGRVTSRQILARLSTYNWLLFLDADMLPLRKDFLVNYLKYIDTDYEAIYGGYFYDKNSTDTRFGLRCQYGKKYEEIDASKRNKKPYKVVLSGNFLIRKQTFLDINSSIKNDGYGYDTHFGALMKLHSTSVLHIDNPAIHNGLETNQSYLRKIENAVETIYEFYLDQESFRTEITLLEIFKTLKPFKLNLIIKLIFKGLKTPLKKNLEGKHPSVKLLQIYKLGYLCSLKPATNGT